MVTARPRTEHPSGDDKRIATKSVVPIRGTSRRARLPQ
jgi:hypothetical protein